MLIYKFYVSKAQLSCTHLLHHYRTAIGNSQNVGNNPEERASCRQPKEQPRPKEYQNQLEHQGRAPDDPDKDPHRNPDRGKPAHGPEAHHKAQRNGDHQGQGEQPQGLPEAPQQFQRDPEKHFHLT